MIASVSDFSIICELNILQITVTIKFQIVSFFRGGGLLKLLGTPQNVSL